MKTTKDFAQALQSFFENYLAKERGVSENTIKAYRDSFVQLIEYLDQRRGIKPERISLELLDKSLVLDFLNWIEEEKHCSVPTRNQRCVAIRSFCQYLMYVVPEQIGRWKQICSIPMKKCAGRPMNYLSVEAVKCILEQIDTSSRQGLRNLTMLSLLYNSGARVQELIDLTPSSIRRDKPYAINLVGKGSKCRVVPLDEDIMRLLVKYMKAFNLYDNEKSRNPLFANTWGEKLSTPGITYVIKKYTAMARVLTPDIIPDKISPHVFRHTRAMHLLQAGVNLIYIRDILGHVSVQTTEVYARADSKQKREALEKAYAEVGITEPKVKSWEKNSKLKEYLKSLA